MVLDRLQGRLGYRFDNPALLAQALTHRSFGEPNNERLEFLGDSLVNCVIATVLYRRFDGLKEGELSRLRASLVRQEGLHKVAIALELGDFLKLGDGEMKSGGHRRPSILADSVEALFGAVYLDGGFEAVQGLIERLYQPYLADLDPGAARKDPKTALQEWLQARKKALPLYEMTDASGEAHAQIFHVTCRIAAYGLNTNGSGTSRRAAEQQAASLALDSLRQVK